MKKRLIILLLVGVVAAVGAVLLWPQETLHPGSSAELQELRDSLFRRDSVRVADIGAMLRETGYYIRTHSVVDDGFDIVSRQDKKLREERDSLLQVIAAPIARPHIQTAAEVHRMLCDTAAVAPQTYFGERDIIGQRAGFGVDITPGERMRVGEWCDDRYLGERITYSEERVYGIDISRYQHEKGRKRFAIDWSKLAITSLGKLSKKKIHGEVNYPISFIYIKATEGKSVRNRYFAADYKQARRHGYRTGAYHFFSTKTGGAIQARFFLKMAKYQKGDLPPVLDVEPSAAQIRAMGGTQAMFREIRLWLRSVEKAWGVRPVLYVGQNFVNKYLPEAPDLMRNYDVWIARYGEYKPDVNLAIWQLSPDGRVCGIKTEVDINVFNGFLDDLAAYGSK